MAIDIALLGFSDLKHSMTLLFFSKTDFIHNYLHIVQDEEKNQCGALPSCGCKAHETMVAKCELVL